MGIKKADRKVGGTFLSAFFTECECLFHHAFLQIYHNGDKLFEGNLMRIPAESSARHGWLFIARYRILVLYINLYKGSMSLSIC